MYMWSMQFVDVLFDAHVKYKNEDENINQKL